MKQYEKYEKYVGPMLMLGMALAVLSVMFTATKSPEEVAVEKVNTFCKGEENVSHISLFSTWVRAECKNGNSVTLDY